MLDEFRPDDFQKQGVVFNPLTTAVLDIYSSSGPCPCFPHDIWNTFCNWNYNFQLGAETMYVLLVFLYP